MASFNNAYNTTHVVAAAITLHAARHGARITAVTCPGGSTAVQHIIRMSLDYSEGEVLVVSDNTDTVVALRHQAVFQPTRYLIRTPTGQLDPRWHLHSPRTVTRRAVMGKLGFQSQHDHAGAPLLSVLVGNSYSSPIIAAVSPLLKEVCAAYSLPMPPEYGVKRMYRTAAVVQRALARSSSHTGYTPDSVFLSALSRSSPHLLRAVSATYESMAQDVPHWLTIESVTADVASPIQTIPHRGSKAPLSFDFPRLLSHLKVLDADPHWLELFKDTPEYGLLVGDPSVPLWVSMPSLATACGMDVPCTMTPLYSVVYTRVKELLGVSCDGVMFRPSNGVILPGQKHDCLVPGHPDWVMSTHSSVDLKPASRSTFEEALRSVCFDVLTSFGDAVSTEAVDSVIRWVKDTAPSLSSEAIEAMWVERSDADSSVFSFHDADRSVILLTSMILGLIVCVRAHSLKGVIFNPLDLKVICTSHVESIYSSQHVWDRSIAHRSAIDVNTAFQLPEGPYAAFCLGACPKGAYRAIALLMIAYGIPAVKVSRFLDPMITLQARTNLSQAPSPVIESVLFLVDSVLPRDGFGGEPLYPDGLIDTGVRFEPTASATDTGIDMGLLASIIKF
eukprot:gnl/Dysnectes_brevis/4625_a6298_535.p1 GENE.gnl/Dysnectes_brevis/4625_a6298_535~~gnl/Dysnectes_brevis/4625_a6298_535.p1  ORF type:complete len:617 (+),score=94.04 gnl/Dysnectes_brevis/4625_a6298_535:427-2277(+)